MMFKLAKDVTTMFSDSENSTLLSLIVKDAKPKTVMSKNLHD